MQVDRYGVLRVISGNKGENALGSTSTRLAYYPVIVVAMVLSNRATCALDHTVSG